MHRAISECLASWEQEHAPNFELFRIIGQDKDSKVARLRDVMARFRMTAGFYAAHSDAGERLLDEAGVDATRLPVVIRYDGQVMIDPTLPDLAHALGVNVKNDVDTCEVAIVGAGPAGLTAAVYAASEGLDTVLLELAFSGGQAGTLSGGQRPLRAGLKWFSKCARLSVMVMCAEIDASGTSMPC